MCLYIYSSTVEYIIRIVEYNVMYVTVIEMCICNVVLCMSHISGLCYHLECFDRVAMLRSTNTGEFDTTYVRSTFSIIILPTYYLLC